MTLLRTRRWAGVGAAHERAIQDRTKMEDTQFKKTGTRGWQIQ
jgi:hypothetical protein